MADTTGTGTIEQGTSAPAGATETSQPAGLSGSEPVASDSSQEQENHAGGEQSFSENGKESGTDTRRPQFRSKNQTIYEVRQKIRERDSYWEGELGTVKQQLAEFQKMFGRGQNQRPSRTFYEAPEDTLREILSEDRKTLKEELLGEFRQTQEERESALTLKQEASEAVKFIRSQKGITDDDIHEIRDILASDRVAQSLGEQPMEQAEYAVYKWQKSRGVTDKTDLKNKARGAGGSSVSTGGTAKTWTEDEMALEMEKLGPVQNWGPEQKAKRAELEREFMSAYKTGRVKK